MKKVKKRFNLQSAIEDLEKRQKIYNDNKTATEKLECVGRFGEKVGKIEDFVGNLSAFDKGLKTIDKWMHEAEKSLKDIKETSGTMTPEDRVSYTMELQEDVASKVQTINDMIKTESGLLPQGDKVPQDAQDFKDELNRIKEFCLDLQKKVMTECDNFSEDVKYWAEYKTGIKEFKPWLTSAQKKSGDGLSKPQDLDQANALYASCKEFRDSCDKNIKILTAANGAAQKMTSHKDADDEVAELKGCYEKVHAVAEEWMKKVDTLVKEWKLLDSTVTELNSWVPEDRKEGEQQFSLEKMESTLGELKNIFKEKEKLVENL